MPFIADSSEEGKFVNRHTNYIIKQYSRVTTEISELLGYSSKIESKIKQYDCEIVLSGVKKDFVQAFKADVTSTIGYIKLTATKDELLANDQQGYKNLLTHIFRLKTIITDFRKEILKYAHTLDMLTANRLNPDVLWYTQSVLCVKDFEEEFYTLKRCEKTTTGLECIIQIEIDNEYKYFDLYTPVSYNLHQLKLPSNNYVVREDNRWGELQCTDRLREEQEIIAVDTCTFKPDTKSCLTSIEKRNFHEITKNCEFEFKIPNPIIQTDDGFLIQSKDLTIREKEADKSKVLDNDVPYFLKTGNKIIMSVHGMEKTYEPREKQAVRTILRTFLTEYQINSLTALQRLQNMEISHFYFEYQIYFGISITLVLIIIIVVICKLKWSVIQQRIAIRHQRQETARVRNSNYRLNRTLLRTGNPIQKTAPAGPV
jgi:hypothetical protein